MWNPYETLLLLVVLTALCLSSRKYTACLVGNKHHPHSLHFTVAITVKTETFYISYLDTYNKQTKWLTFWFWAILISAFHVTRTTSHLPIGTTVLLPYSYLQALETHDTTPTDEFGHPTPGKSNKGVNYCSLPLPTTTYPLFHNTTSNKQTRRKV